MLSTQEYKVDEQPHCHRCCESGWQPRGKQSLQPGFIMYSAATGRAGVNQGTLLQLCTEQYTTHYTWIAARFFIITCCCSTGGATESEFSLD